jgi:hypothetical protein
VGFVETARSIEVRRIVLAALFLIPYLDTEVLAAIPGVRQLPGVDAVYWLELSWTERGRLVLLIVVPYALDGELIELLTGKRVPEVIADG